MRYLGTIGLAFLMAGALWEGRAAGAAGWYPPSEPSPFLPDDARWIAGSSQKTTHFRGTWFVKGPVKRAVLMTAPRQMVRVHLNGRLALETYDSHQALPAWAEVTDRLRGGENFVAARVYCEWEPSFYAQMRVEYLDGSWEDFTTGPGWEWADEPGEGWMAPLPAAPGGWQPVKDAGGYSIEGESFWGREFALLPRQRLFRRFAAHNRKLRAAWPQDRQEAGLILKDPPERKEWADQFADFCRVDEASGQLLDGTGRVRHLFFNLYGQAGGLSVHGFDLEQFERDLDLLAQADVHLYFRMLGWNWLLTRDGEWAKLERQPPGAGNRHFEYGRDLLDYVVQRAWAHGRYIMFEGDFFWGAHPLIPPPYRSRYHLYPEVLESQALATRKIMNRYRNCRNVLGIMIGEEDIVLDHDLQNPHQHTLFADFLRRKYGTLEAFKKQTPWGYDYRDRSAYGRGKWTAERWPDQPHEEVLVPGYQARLQVFDGVQDWLDIPLPEWPWPRSVEEPEVTLGGCVSHNQFSPEDPLWIDFYEMREDELLFGMLRRWAEIVRPAMPRQLLFYSNAQDFTASWHFLHLYRRAELPFDVIGVGCHDSGQNLSDLPPWATVRKAIKNISSYRPYVLSPGSPARSVASGEGEGGRADQPEEVLNYYRGALFDEIGGGAAWTQTYSWLHISGAEGGQPPHLTPFLKWLGSFMPAVQGVAFPLRRPVQVLIVRHTNLAHSNMSGLDYGNVMAVAEALTQLNVEFDIVMDRDLVYRKGTPCKTDLSAYRLVILPSVALDFPEPVWGTLDAWLSDPAFQGRRVLALGWIGKRSPRLQPHPAFHPLLQRWLESTDYPDTVLLQGKQPLTFSPPPHLPTSLEIDFGRIPPTGLFRRGQPILRTAQGQTIAARFAYRGNAIYAFGFPLGFAHEPLWGLAPEQQPRDAVVPLYEALAQAARVDRPIRAPHNLRVYVAQGGKMILVRERAGLKTTADLAVRVPAGTRYQGLILRRSPGGYARFQVTLEPWEGKWFKAEEKR